MAARHSRCRRGCRLTACGFFVACCFAAGQVDRHRSHSALLCAATTSSDDKAATTMTHGGDHGAAAVAAAEENGAATNTTVASESGHAALECVHSERSLSLTSGQCHQRGVRGRHATNVRRGAARRTETQRRRNRIVRESDGDSLDKRNEALETIDTRVCGLVRRARTTRKREQDRVIRSRGTHEAVQIQTQTTITSHGGRWQADLVRRARTAEVTRRRQGSGRRRLLTGQTQTRRETSNAGEME
jgi:hypothetical protein